MLFRSLDLGINYIDTAPAYFTSDDSISEVRIGEVIADGRRDEFYLATKTDRRTSRDALSQLEVSLTRLRTDRIDCWQIHHLDEFSELDVIFGRGGAIEAIERAKRHGLTRFVGVTGHSDPAVLLEALKRYPFDTVLMALNPADKHINSFQQNLLPYCVKNNIGVIAMKVFSRGAMFVSPIGAVECIRYVMGLPVSTMIIGISNVEQLERNIQISLMPPLNEAEMGDLEFMTEPHASEMLFYRRDGSGNWEAYENIEGLPQQVL